MNPFKESHFFTSNVVARYSPTVFPNMAWCFAKRESWTNIALIRANFRATSLISLQTAVLVEKHWEFGWSHFDELRIIRFQADPVSSFQKTLCPPYLYPLQAAVAWSESTTVHGRDMSTSPRVTSGDCKVDTDDMEIFCDQFIDQMWTDWLKMPKEATCFLVAHWHLKSMGFECERWVLGDATTNWDIKQIGGKR